MVNLSIYFKYIITIKYKLNCDYNCTNALIFNYSKKLILYHRNQNTL